MIIEDLIRLNRRLNIQEVNSLTFKEYGKIMVGYDFSELLGYMERETSIPEEGNIYKASVPELEAFAVYERLSKGFYGEMPIQIGYCNGRNSTLNGLEYHIGSEIDIAASDFVLLLGRLQDVADDRYSADRVDAFFVPKGNP